MPRVTAVVVDGTTRDLSAGAAAFCNFTDDGVLVAKNTNQDTKSTRALENVSLAIAAHFWQITAIHRRHKLETHDGRKEKRKRSSQYQNGARSNNRRLWSDCWSTPSKECRPNRLGRKFGVRQEHNGTAKNHR